MADAAGNLVVPSRAPNTEHAALGSSALSCFTVLFLSYVTILLFGMGVLLCTSLLEVCDLFLAPTGLTAEELPESQNRLCTLLLLETIKVHGDRWKGNGCILHCEMTMNLWGHRVESYDLKEVSLGVTLTRAGLVMIKTVNLM